LNLISRFRLTSNNIEEANKLIGIRDPHGIRPLCIGRIDDSYVLASETCALDAVDAEYEESGMTSIQTEVPEKTALCIFEYIYFARPDSYIDGVSVHRARIEAGRRLAREHPVEADLVFGVPDSGVSAALGYSMESGIPYDLGLIKNKYIGRTFIQPEQGQRESGVKIKLNALKEAVNGKRVVMIDPARDLFKF